MVGKSSVDLLSDIEQSGMGLWYELSELHESNFPFTST